MLETIGIGLVRVVESLGLRYGFMQRALLTGIFIGIASSLLGIFLMLRRYSLIGDGLAHISFGGIAAGLMFKISPFVSALIFAIIGSIIISKMHSKTNLYGETAIGIVSHAILGIGILIISIINGLNINIMSFLFGSILAISYNELLLSAILSLLVIIFCLVFYYDLFYMSFNEESAKVSGINVGLLNFVLMLLAAVIVVLSMRIVGLLLASSLIIFPAASALQLRTSFKKTILASAIISLISIVSGIFISYTFNSATSGTIVCLNSIIFVILYLFSNIKNNITNKVIKNCTKNN